MAIIGYGKSAKCGPVLTKPVFTYSVNLTFPQSVMTSRGFCECRATVLAGPLMDTRIFTRNVHWKSDSLQKNSWAQNYPSLDSLKWVFFHPTASSLLPGMAWHCGLVSKKVSIHGGFQTKEISTCLLLHEEAKLPSYVFRKLEYS